MSGNFATIKKGAVGLAGYGDDPEFSESLLAAAAYDGKMLSQGGMDLSSAGMAVDRNYHWESAFAQILAAGRNDLEDVKTAAKVTSGGMLMAGRPECLWFVAIGYYATLLDLRRTLGQVLIYPSGRDTSKLLALCPGLHNYLDGNQLINLDPGVYLRFHLNEGSPGGVGMRSYRIRVSRAQERAVSIEPLAMPLGWSDL